jgi:hypothetical protein
MNVLRGDSSDLRVNVDLTKEADVSRALAGRVQVPNTRHVCFTTIPAQSRRSPRP